MTEECIALSFCTMHFIIIIICSFYFASSYDFQEVVRTLKKEFQCLHLVFFFFPDLDIKEKKKVWLATSQFV